MTDVKAAVTAKGISRICHFTPSRNLQHIAAGKMGVLSTAALEQDERGCYNPTDLARFDRKKTHICCSVEYPNAWYFDKARNDDRVFPDWVVLLIDPKYLWDENTLFCPRNAAADYGRHIVTGLNGFEGMYADRVIGTRNATYARSPTHMLQCPTDQQAEVLIADRILIEDIMGVAVESADQAKMERTRLRINGIDADRFRFVVAPHMFQKYVLSGAITSGKRPPELAYQPTRSTGKGA